MSNKPEIDIEFEGNGIIKNRSYNRDTENIIETLFSQGNGYMISRACIEESTSNKINYTGNYIVGLYNKASHIIGDKKIERDEIVNLPNWWFFNFRIGNSSWFDINRSEITEFERVLDIKNGVLSKTMIVKDKIGQLTRIESKKVISYSNPNIIGQTYSIEPLNYKGKIKVSSQINGNIYNEQDLKTKHLYISKKEGYNNTSYMFSETLKTNLSILILTKTDSYIDDTLTSPDIHFFEKEREITGEWEIELDQNQKITVQKTGYVNDFGLIVNTKNEITKAHNELKQYKTFDDIVDESTKKWKEIWDNCLIEIEDEENTQSFVSFYIYHLLITYSQNTNNSVSGFPTFSVQGEKNHGLSGWEELFILPFFNHHLPGVSKKALEYRKERLENAKTNASFHGIKGALFPWKSGIEGTEQTYKEKFDKLNNKWVEDPGFLQRHVNLSIAYNIIQYYKSTNDIEFIKEKGLDTLVEICRFWANSVVFDRASHRYSINGLIGPDEFHTKYPLKHLAGINNNAYTNFMVVWILKQVIQLIKELPKEEFGGLYKENGIKQDEIDKWNDISMFIKIEISDDEIIEQFTGFFKLDQIDWVSYRKKFPDLHNIADILNAEGKNVNDLQVIKQADTLLPFYFLSPEEIRNIMLDTGYLLEKRFLDFNFDYYYHRTSHASLLSKPVHALISYHNNYVELCFELFNQALFEVKNFHYNEILNNGINMGVAGALCNVIQVAFAGLTFKENHLVISPNLPKTWKKIKFNFFYKGGKFNLLIKENDIELTCLEEPQNELTLDYHKREYSIRLGKSIKLEKPQ